MCSCASAVASVLSASHLNAYGRRHWKSLGVSQNYFDQTGVFVSFLWSAPLAIVSFGILINAVWNASNLLITVKRQQLAANKRATTPAKSDRATAAAVTPVEPLDQEVRTAAAAAPASSTKQRKGKSAAK